MEAGTWQYDPGGGLQSPYACLSVQRCREPGSSRAEAKVKAEGFRWPINQEKAAFHATASRCALFRYYPKSQDKGNSIVKLEFK